MDKKLFSIRLRTARELRGYSLEKLASLVMNKVTKQSFSRYEKGVMKPKKLLLDSIAAALEISPEYFEGTNINLDNAMLRTSSHDRVCDVESERIEAIMSYRIEQYLHKSELLEKQLLFSNPLDHNLISEFEDACDAAEQLRTKWNCGDGSIPSVIRLLERKGVLIFASELPDGVMGLSTWADGKYPVILVDLREDKTTVERLRFTLCHELAHLLLTFDDDVNVEKCCDKFAGFFLLPSRTLKEEIGEHRDQLFLEELIDMREAYGVSVAALIHQAYDLNIISREHYDWWYDEMIKPNRKEDGWGEYKFPEILSKEKRMDIRINNTNK